ncbi:MAG: chromosome segregation protein SMC [Cytophagales bacterium]|nr:chromosome segregation protein SMC [Cytophagales bacterium]MDW8384603.1 chromosome segregation protein SMC [Flammeovirgaceae bacterium]
MTSSQSNTEKTTKSWLYAMIVLLISTNSAWFFYHRSKLQTENDKLDFQQSEMVATYAKLDSVSRQLDNKIVELEQMGMNIDSLLMIKTQLEKEKRELIASRNLAQSRYEEIKSKLEGYEILLKQKDIEISELKKANQYLVSENYSLKEERNVLNDQILTLKSQSQALAEKVNVASALRAINIRFIGVTSKGKEKEDAEFKAKQLSKIKILFNIDENNLAEIGAKKIYLRIIDPEGSALYNLATGSGSFMYQGNELFYTEMQEILFDNSKQLVVFEYSKGTEFKTGKHRVELYCQGVKMGEGSFIVK